MVEFIEQYGASIVAIIIAIAGMVTAVFNFKKAAELNKQIKTNADAARQDVAITRQGVIDAFKSAKIPTEWKIDVSNKISASLSAFRDEMITLIKSNQATQNDMLLIAIKILQFTKASEKLSDEDKAKLDEFIQKIGEEDKTIDITE